MYEIAPDGDWFTIMRDGMRVDSFASLLIAGEAARLPTRLRY